NWAVISDQASHWFAGLRQDYLVALQYVFDEGGEFSLGLRDVADDHMDQDNISLVWSGLVCSGPYGINACARFAGADSDAPGWRTARRTGPCLAGAAGGAGWKSGGGRGSPSRSRRRPSGGIRKCLAPRLTARPPRDRTPSASSYNGGGEPGARKDCQRN